MKFETRYDKIYLSTLGFGLKFDIDLQFWYTNYNPNFIILTNCIFKLFSHTRNSNLSFSPSLSRASTQHACFVFCFVV